MMSSGSAYCQDEIAERNYSEHALPDKPSSVDVPPPQDIANACVHEARARYELVLPSSCVIKAVKHYAGPRGSQLSEK